ncbi:NapD protein [Aeromonas diversa CDC 2478-85]|uniref:Chaperone NapD n=1 Tax=Aeromonas diversa CDC 2478-85 TaxID=1268237 RepID=N9TW78_9GAMM|nr:chaperone NapD [Aeromonas diversa]ENY70379.1 NapD protein [Aeromonas diversa CDC 2478-85]
MKHEESGEYHVSSLLVLTQPAKRHEVAAAVALIEGAEVHAVSDEGKLVVTLEGGRQRQIIEAIDRINAVPSVISAALIYHQFDEQKQCEDLS